MISVHEADDALSRHILVSSPAFCALDQAYGRILREDLIADRPLPPFDRVAMDGIAVRSHALPQGLRTLALTGTQRAGVPPLMLADGSACIEVMTGAVLPEGADAVVPVEQILRKGDHVEVGADVEIQAHQHVHRLGTDKAAGSVLVHAGVKLGPAELGIAASIGKAELAVSPMLRAAVVSTGDELIDPAFPVEPHQIRRSNPFALAAALQASRLAKGSLFHLTDDERRIQEQLPMLLSHDVVIFTGGVSMGKFDLLPNALRQAGVQQVFHKIEQKPGKPLWFGVGQGGRPVFGLPGNPVAALICFFRYVLPALRRMAGAAEGAPLIARLAEPISVKRWIEFVPVRMQFGEDGVCLARRVPLSGSADYAALADADGFVEVAAGAPASTARLFLWREIA